MSRPPDTGSRPHSRQYGAHAPVGKGRNCKALSRMPKRGVKSTGKGKLDGRTYGLTWGAPKPVRPSVMAVSLWWSAERTLSHKQGSAGGGFGWRVRGFVKCDGLWGRARNASPAKEIFVTDFARHRI